MKFDRDFGRPSNQNFIGPKEKQIYVFGGVLVDMLSVLPCWKYIESSYLDILFQKIDRHKQKGYDVICSIESMSEKSGDDFIFLKTENGILKELKLLKRGKSYEF